MPRGIDPTVANLSPNLYNAALISGLSTEQSKLLNQLSKQYTKGTELLRLGKAAGRKEFLDLDPTVQNNIRLFFPDKEIFEEEKGLLQQALSVIGGTAKAILSVPASPFLIALDLLDKHEKVTKTPVSAGRAKQEALKAEKLGLPVTERADFTKGILKDTYNGKNNWKWDKVDAYEQRYGVALTTLARGIAEGRTPGEAIELYGDPNDPEIMAAFVLMWDKPEKFNQIKDALKVDAQISPGRDVAGGIISSTQSFVDGNFWVNKTLKFLGINPNTDEGKKQMLKIAGVKNVQQAETKLKEMVSGPIDAVYTIGIDPFTYYGLGLPAVAKMATKGIGGIRVGVGEAFKMAAFKTKGQRLAEQFKFVSERQGQEQGYAWLFDEPEIKQLWDNQLGPRLREFSEAKGAVAKASVLESIRFDFPEWYNDSVIKALTSGPVKAFDAASAKKYFTEIDDAFLILNGRVNGISFRRNGIPYARKTRTMTSAMHRIAYSIFNPSSELDTTTQAILDKGDAEAKRFMTILTKVADEENKLLNPEIDNIFEIQKDISSARRMAYKLGTMFTRVPGVIKFGDDAIDTANEIRNTANLVMPKNIANAVTLLLLDEPLDIQLTAVRNMHYAYMKRLDVPEDEIQKILQKTFNEQAALSAVPDLPIATNVASMMHPMAVLYNNGQPQLTGSSGIQPAQLSKAIKQLPFELIYQLSAKSRLDDLSPATPAKSLVRLFGGFTRSNALRVYNNNWAAYTLAPRLGIRTNVDEGFFYYLTKPIEDIVNLVASKFQKDIKGMQAATGSSAAIGPWKGSLYWFANKMNVTVGGRPLDPRQILTPGERGELLENLRVAMSKPVSEGGLGYDIPLSELQPVLIKETILSRIEDVLKVNGEEWENWKRLFRNNSNFTESIANSMGARDLAIGKIDRDFFESLFTVDQLTLFIKELGLERSSLYTPKEVKKLSELQLGVAMWDNFVIRFGFNQIKIGPATDDWLSPVNAFYDNNGLRTDADFASARTQVMEQMGVTYNGVTGAYDTLSKGVGEKSPLKYALANFADTPYYRQKGLTDPEIARIYAERMLTDMRFAFHGSAEGFNQELYDLMLKKHAEIIKAAPRTGMAAVTAYSRAANNLTWKEFDEATVGRRPTSGYINTRLVSDGKNKEVDLDALKEDLSSFDKMFERFPDTVLEMMDRQVTGFFRLPAMRVAINKAFSDLKPFEKLLSDRHYKAILDANPALEPGEARNWANEIADKTVSNIAVNMASDAVLEFVDNPNIRSNIALSIKHLGRFARATEDFQRRVYRLYANEGPRAISRMRLLHYGLENMGSVYEDENGDEYLTIPSDIVINMALKKTFDAVGLDYKVGEFNDFTFKFRLSNPSFAPDAGVPAFAGPVSGIFITGTKWFLRDLPVVSAILPDKWEDAIYPWTNKIADYLDMYAMGHIGRNTDIGEAVRLAFPMLATTLWDGLASPDVNRIKANYVTQAIAYTEAFGNGIPDFASNKEKVAWLNTIKTAAGNVAAAQSMMGMLSPAYPSLKDAKGLPEFIKDNGISTWSSAFWDIYKGVIASEPDVANPFELAVAMYIGKNPGKSIYTIPKTSKPYKVLIAKTDELKQWSVDNKRFVKDYQESGIAYVFAPMSGEYNPDMYNWLESQGLVEQVEFKDYLQKVQIAVDKEKYYAIDEALAKKLAKEPDYVERRALITAANQEQRALLTSNPELEDALDDGISGKQLKTMFQDIKAAVNDKEAPMSEATRISMRFAAEQVQAFIDYSENPVYKSKYTFSDDRAKMKQEIKDLLSQLVFDPSVKEASKLIFIPLLNKYSRDVLGASVEKGYYGR